MPSQNYIDINDDGKLVSVSEDHYGQYKVKIIGEPVNLEKISEVHETKSFRLKLNFRYLGEEKTLIIPREHLKRNELLKYSEKGLPVIDANVTYIAEYIQMQEQNKDIRIERIHVGIGWDTIEDEKTGEILDVFKGYKALGMKSRYDGNLPLKPVGKDLDSFKGFVTAHVIGTPLVLAVVSGLTGALVGFIGKRIHCNNLVMHIYGDSSTGKTTFAKLAVSMGSCPEFSDTSLLTTYHATENALLARVVNNFGFPFCFDEANMSKMRDSTSFLYTLESGIEKGRLNREATLKEQRKFQTVIISTGEKSLSEDSNQHTGKELRVQQFGNIVWTKDAESAEAISEYVMEHYGFQVYSLARLLLKLGRDEVIKRYNRNREVFIKNSKINDSFTKRLSIKYALLLTTLELANEAMNLDLPYDYLLEMLLNNEAESTDSRDLAQKAYDYLLEQANVHRDKFSVMTDGGQIENARYGAWGMFVYTLKPEKIGKKTCGRLILFAKETFIDLLKAKGFENVNVVIKKMKQKKMLDHDSDRDTRFRRIMAAGPSIHVYALRVFNKRESDLWTPEIKTTRPWEDFLEEQELEERKKGNKKARKKNTRGNKKHDR